MRHLSDFGLEYLNYFHCSNARAFLIATIKKMQKVFPLADDILPILAIADQQKRDRFSVTEVRTLARKFQFDDTEIDAVETDWRSFSSEVFDDETLTVSPVDFWSKSSYPTLASLMRIVLSIPHSNASSERVFSMLKKITTDQRHSLDQATVQSLLATKLNFQGCCLDVKRKLNTDLKQKLKTATMEYNRAHSSQ
jgi:hypothetical protein